jgi:oligopeptide/dipeptide ABC transporter ATP-binding protein
VDRVTPLLEVRDLVKHFGAVRAVEGVTFSVAEGEVLALVGESGCGKSTTGRCLLRLIEPSSGEVRFAGQDVLRLTGARLRRLRQHMQIVFQDPFSSLDPRMTAGQAIGEPLFVHRLCPRREIGGRVAELLGMVGLTAADAARLPHEFSGGQRQRIAIARALATSPKLVVADEPVAALDVSVQAQIINLMQDLRERLGIAYLLISHNLSLVSHIADRVAVMYLGRILENGSAAALFGGARHPYTQALLASIPIPDPSQRGRRALLPGDVPDARHVPPGCRFHPRCPYAMDRCSTEAPQLLPCGDGLEAACWLAQDGDRGASPAAEGGGA